LARWRWRSGTDWSSDVIPTLPAHNVTLFESESLEGRKTLDEERELPDAFVAPFVFVSG
jgi:hypothetical protein